jgi:hypothetical protein
MIKSRTSPGLGDAAAADGAAGPRMARRLLTARADAMQAGRGRMAILVLLAAAGGGVRGLACALPVLAMAGSAAHAAAPDNGRARVSAGKAPAPGTKVQHGAPVVTWLTFQDQHDADPVRRGADRFTALPADQSESITVYGKRRPRAAGWHGDDAPLAFAGVTVTGSRDTGLPGVSGLTIRASTPLSIVPGLDLELNVTGGHEQINDSSTVPTAAAVAGVRLHF